jgi:hypothetical protein
VRADAGSPESADDLAVSLQIENLKRARFKSGDDSAVRRATNSAAAIRARIAGIWGGVTPSRRASRGVPRVLASVQEDSICA